MWISKKKYMSLVSDRGHYKRSADFWKEANSSKWGRITNLECKLDKANIALRLDEMTVKNNDAITFPDKVSFFRVDAGTTAQFLNNHPDLDIISGEKSAVVVRARKTIRTMAGLYHSVTDPHSTICVWYIIERDGRLETWEAKELRIIEPKPKKKASCKRGGKKK